MSIDPEDYDFYLVQRLQPNFMDATKVECEYMGSAEYEFGAVPKARKRLVASDELIRAQVDIPIGDISKTVYFLGPLSDFEVKIEAMKSWINRGFRCKEPSFFDLVFLGRDWCGDPLPAYYRTVVWWSLDDDLVWSLSPEWLDAFVLQRELHPIPFGTL